jgi:hypothetical protein
MNIIEAAEWVKYGGFVRHDGCGKGRCYGRLAEPEPSYYAQWHERGRPESYQTEDGGWGDNDYLDFDDLLRTDWIKCDRHGEPLP